MWLSPSARCLQDQLVSLASPRAGKSPQTLVDRTSEDVDAEAVGKSPDAGAAHGPASPRSDAPLNAIYKGAPFNGALYVMVYLAVSYNGAPFNGALYIRVHHFMMRYI